MHVLQKTCVKNKTNLDLVDRCPVTLFVHVGRFHDLGVCQLYSMSLLNKVGVVFYYSYIHAELEDLGGVILPTWCAWNIVHPIIFLLAY